MADESPDPRTPHGIAIERFKLGAKAREDQRKREKVALEFQVPEKQWPDDVRASREAQTVPGTGMTVPARPMLSIPSLDQPIQLVLNQEKAAQLGAQIQPLSEDADDDTAEVIQGLYRQIEVDSRAQVQRGFAFERGVKAGTGEYEIVTVYDEDGGSKFDQKILIKRILHQGSVVRDPFAQEADWSDGMWAFKPTDMAWSTYKQKYPKSKLATFSEDDLNDLAEEREGWITGDGEGRAVRIAAYYEIRVTSKKIVLMDDGSEAFEGEFPAGRAPMAGKDAKSRDCEERTLWYSIINAVEELEPAQEQNGKYIPLVFYSGRELIPFDGERRWIGIIEPNIDAVRMLNYSASGAVESASLEPRASFDIDPEEIEGLESYWHQANIRNFPYLPRHKWLHGQVMPQPGRHQADMSKVQMNATLLQMSREFIHSGTGAFEPTLGQDSHGQNSGKKVLALQQQHDQGNSHFLDNLAEISMPYEAKVILDLIPHIYDRPGRIARILDREDNQKTVMLNAPFVMDPQNKRPMKAPTDPGQQKVQHYDLNKGRYGVRMSVGKAKESRLAEGNDALSQLFQADPQLFQLYGDIWFGFQTWPGHQTAQERAKKMLPPPLQDQDESQQAEQQLQALKAQVDQMGQQLSQAADMLKTEHEKYQAQVEIKKLEFGMKERLAAMEFDYNQQIQRMKDGTALAVKKLDLLGKGVIAAHEAEDEELALGRQHAHEVVEAEKDREAQMEAAKMAQAHALEQGAQSALTGATSAAQGHQQSLEQGEQGHQQALDQQAQAAALTPLPEDDGA